MGSIERLGAATIWAFALLLTGSRLMSAQMAGASNSPAVTVQGSTNPLQQDLSGPHHFEAGAIVQGGVGLTQNRDGFKFIMAGVHAGKILTSNLGRGPLRGNFEYAVEVFPYWQSFTPKFQRALCTNLPGTPAQCSAPFTVGGTFSGVTVIPIILRWNLVGTKHFAFWGQAAGGLLWTNHKYPAYGGPPFDSQNDGPNADASVFNFTPQGGVGLHYFIHPRRSIDFSANGIHLSSASLGDRNPGVNASVQFSLGYSWWK